MALQGTKALQRWCEIVTEGYEGVKILNMTTSWRSGLGFCAIIHHFRPDIMDFESLNTDDVFGNNQLAFSQAEQHLGIPALLDPQDMVECELLDRLSILTYLSQFFQAFHGATVPNSASSKPAARSSSSARSGGGSLGSSPVKMPVVGKKNEPCKICSKPVFILERLNVTGKLLHRTCFKCARCQTQLNVLNYYETENGNYCCDMCPDEEKNFSQVVQANKKIAEEHLDSGLEDSTDSESEDVATTKADQPALDIEGNQKMDSKSDTAVNDNESEPMPDTDRNANCLLEAEGNAAREGHDILHEEATATIFPECEDEKKAVIPVIIEEKVPETEENSNNPFDEEEDKGTNKEDASEIMEEEPEKRLYPDLSKEAPEVPEPPEALSENVESCRENNRGPDEPVEETPDPKVVAAVLETGASVENIDASNDELLETERDNTHKESLKEASGPNSADDSCAVDNHPGGSGTEAIVLPKEPETEKNLSKSDKYHDDLTHEALPPASDVEKNVEEHEKQYPDDLNPFGDDDDEDIPTDPKKLENDLKNTELKKDSTNPFGSDFEDDDDDDRQNSVVTPGANKNVPTHTAQVLAGPPKPPRASLNPFGSDFEDDDDISATSSFLQSPASPSISVRSRKKRQAPKPPGASPSPVPSPRSSKRLSAPVPTPRTSRPAPPRPASPSLSIVSSASTATLGRPRPPRPPPPTATGTSELPKERKERDNLNRRSQAMFERPESLPPVEEAAQKSHSNPKTVLSPLSPDKAVVEGQWKKKKGPAPPRPIPQKRQVKKLPRKAVNTELHDIEIKQQELERQGVKLERSIRELCEQGDRERSEQGLDNNDRDSLGPEVEDLIVQLFDLVNEKNDLFRRQTELMYMKKDHRLEEEYADTEHQIRMLMDGKPESQKTADDSAKEEKLIARLMELVAQRNEIVDCLEMDRLREKEEDESFEIHMGEYAAIKPVDEAMQEKKKKKEKKKEKKKRKKDKNFDADKDIDTSEFPSPKPSPKKEKSLSSQSDKDKAKKLGKKILSTLSVASLKKT